MPSKKRITRVWFIDASRTANQPSTPPTTSRHAGQRYNSQSNTHAQNAFQIIAPTSPALSSNVSTPLTPSPQIPKLDHIKNKIFSKSLIASLTSKDAVLKDVRDCIFTNNESRPKALNPYIHSYWRDLHVRSGSVCVDEKVAIPNVLREALIDDIHASHPGTLGLICMATHWWWPYMNWELVAKAATECKLCTMIDEDTVMPEEILPDEKWINGYRSYIEVEAGMTRASQEAHNREQESTDGESRFIRTRVCRPHGKRRSKKNLEGLYEVLAPGSQILKVSPTTSTIKEPGKPIVTVRRSDIAKFGTLQEEQTPLKCMGTVEDQEQPNNWRSNRSKATLNSSQG